MNMKKQRVVNDHMSDTELRALAWLRVAYASWLRHGDPVDRRDVRLMTYILVEQSGPRFTYQR